MTLVDTALESCGFGLRKHGIMDSPNLVGQSCFVAYDRNQWFRAYYAKKKHYTPAGKQEWVHDILHERWVCIKLCLRFACSWGLGIDVKRWGLRGHANLEERLCLM